MKSNPECCYHLHFQHIFFIPFLLSNSVVQGQNKQLRLIIKSYMTIVLYETSPREITKWNLRIKKVSSLQFCIFPLSSFLVFSIAKASQDKWGTLGIQCSPKLQTNHHSLQVFHSNISYPSTCNHKISNSRDLIRRPIWLNRDMDSRSINSLHSVWLFILYFSIMCKYLGKDSRLINDFFSS